MHYNKYIPAYHPAAGSTAIWYCVPLPSNTDISGHTTSMARASLHSVSSPCHYCPWLGPQIASKALLFATNYISLTVPPPLTAPMRSDFSKVERHSTAVECCPASPADTHLHAPRNLREPTVCILQGTYLPPIYPTITHTVPLSV